MNFSKCVKCIDCPCLDVNKECYIVPSIEVDPAKSKAFMVSEAHPKDPNEYFYAKGDARASCVRVPPRFWFEPAPSPFF